MPQLEHFAIYAADTVALAEFYMRVFGMHIAVKTASDPPAFFLVDNQGMAIEIIGRPTGTTGANQRWVCHLAFSVDNVAAKRAELEGIGLVFETDTVVDTDEMKTAFFNDPAGNRCQIVWRGVSLAKQAAARAGQS
jgi:glyoxylase I family protein